MTPVLHRHDVEDGEGFGRVYDARQRQVACRGLRDEPALLPHRVQELRILAHCLLQTSVHNALRLVGFGEALRKQMVPEVALVGRVMKQATKTAAQCKLVLLIPDIFPGEQIQSLTVNKSILLV